MKVIGIQRNVSFKYGNDTFSGMNIYTSEDKPGVEGVISNKYFINDAKSIYKEAEKVKIGDEISFSYNRFGKPEALSIL